MYKNVFDNYLKTNKIFDAYMFWGQSDFLIETYASKVALLFASHNEIQKVYFDEYDFDTCYNILCQPSLFTLNNILLIKTAKQIPKKEVDSLIKICHTNSNSYIIFACMADSIFKDMSTSFTKETNSVEVRFFTPNTNEAIKILNDEASLLNVKFEQSALVHLYEMHEKNLSLCVSDIKKLSILNETVTTKMVTNHCFGMGAVSIDDVLIKLFTNQNFNNSLYKLLEEGLSEMYLLNQTITFVQQLFMINTYLKLYGSLDILQIWGYPLFKNIANQRASIAVKFNQKQFSKFLDFLLNLELELKTLKISDTNAYIQAKFRVFKNIINQKG
jgi:DNA polymerase-3 subunit delta